MDKQLLDRTTQQLKLASNVSPTTNGPSDSLNISDDQISAINQIFELFRFNYHNQFLKAFPDLTTLNMAKRLWARLLNEYSGEVIMRAAEKTVKESSWLPNIHDVISNCNISDAYGLPSAYSAYIEACRAPAPKKEFAWSHPIVYYAGAASDWYFLANTPEQQAYPVFKRNYEILLNRLQQGEEISLNIPQAIPEKVEIYLSKEENLQQLAKIKQMLKQN